MPRLPFSISIWEERPGASIATLLEHMYWHYDAVADEWTLTDDRHAENGRFVDLDGDGSFDLVLLPILAVAPALAATRRGGIDILIY